MTLCPNHYWNTSLQLLLLQKPIIFPFKNHLLKLTCPWWQYAELHRVRWTKIPLSPRKGNIGGCHYNTVAMGCVSDSLALLSCAEDAFGFKNDWKYSDLKYSYLVEFVWRDAHEADDVSVVGVVECDHLFGSGAGGGQSQSQVVSLGARVDEENNFQLWQTLDRVTHFFILVNFHFYNLAVI